MTSLQSALPPPLMWRSGRGHWLPLALGAAALLALFAPTLEFMMSRWNAVEEYSYGWLIPPLCAFLVWLKSDELRRERLEGSWAGLGVLALALVLGAVGQLSAIRMLSQYGFVVGVFGLSLAAIGWRGTRIIAVPLAMLLFMIPLPQFLLREVSLSLQLVSSQIGVALIRAAGISVFLEGNVIDLGSYKLQVVEACSGLRYLFPLLVMGCLAAYFFRAPWWKRALLIASTVPLTVLINSLRIGVIGFTVEHWGVRMAEGLLHDLEGGFMFLVCLVLLGLEMMLLARLGGGADRPRWRDQFGIDLPERAPADASAMSERPLARPALAALALLVAVTAAMWAWPERNAEPPARASFGQFPLELEGGWQGRAERLDADVVAALAVDDYLLANYLPGTGSAIAPRAAAAVNLYVAYYGSQSGGESSHSPRTCIPGDGWAILELREVQVTPTLRVNQAVILKGEHRQLVWYWFRQRGHLLTAEWEVKWWILRDALLRGRSDGALIRLVTPIHPAEGAAAAERRLKDFLRVADPRLTPFIPD